MMRRTFLRLLGALSLCPAALITEVHAQSAGPKMSLLKAPLELGGVWTSSPPDAVNIDRLTRISLAKKLTLMFLRS